MIILAVFFFFFLFFLIKAKNKIADLNEKYADFIDLDKEKEIKNTEIATLEKKYLDLNGSYEESYLVYEDLKNQIELYNDSLDISSYGLYKPKFDLNHSEAYVKAIEANYDKQKNAIKEAYGHSEATISNVKWTVNDSKTEGNRMIKRNRKLILYAFNGECDSIISKVKWNNATKMEERIEKAFKDINKLGEVFSIYITDYFKNLKIEELSLTHEYEEKKYQEKEEQKRIREQMREEDRAQKELEKEQREAEDEEKRFQKALDKARKELGSVSQNELEELNKQISSLEQRLKDAHERKERALSMAQMTKVGHIYVISNIGSFGVGVVKIGMTRRLDPLDRVKELGDASVPFQFDIHAIIHSENAPELERQLHKKFQDQRLNRINSRKEFFRVGLEEIEEFVKGHLNAQIEFTLLAEAREYRETIYLSNTPLDTSLETTNEKEFPKSLLSK
jgi:hypothetical protein